MLKRHWRKEPCDLGAEECAYRQLYRKRNLIPAQFV
jgi:hypothetical protein